MATQICYSDVPLWLTYSDFYENLNSDEPGTYIEVPSDCFRASSSDVNTVEDLIDVVKVIRFWGVQQIPQSVLEFCFSNEASVWDAQLAKAVGEGNLEHTVLKMAFEDNQLFSMQVALKTTRPELVSFWLTKIESTSLLGENAIAQACRFGRLDLVQTLLDRGFPWDKYAYCAAAQYGHAHILEFLHSKNYPCESETQQFAARGGHLKCMKYLHSIGCEWDVFVTTEFAVPKHYVTVASRFNSHPWEDDLSCKSPVGGYLYCLRFALENGCPLHDSACSIASGYGLLDCLILLHQYGAILQAWCTTDAAAAGYLDCLKYLHDHGCPWHKYTTASAAAGGHFDCLKYLHKHGCDWNTESFESAALRGSLDCIRYLHENNCPYSNAVMLVVTSHGDLDCLQYLHSQGYSWDNSSAYNAAEGGFIDCLQYMHQHDCPWDVTVTSVAASQGHLACLQYLHENGCPWHENTTLWASEQGHFDCMFYAIEHGCSYSEREILIAAAQSGCIKNLKYLVETRNVKFTDCAAFADAFCRTHFECMKYLIDHGSPFKDFFFQRVSGACDDAGLLKCIEYAVQHGWRTNANLLKFVRENHFVQCIAFVQANYCKRICLW